MIEMRSILAGALFGLAIVLIYVGVRRLIDKARDSEDRRRGYWPLNAGLIALALSYYLIADPGS